MADRERKRAEKQKRKQRSNERRAELAAKRAAMSERTEAKNEAVRQQLEPLEKGERPTVVTIAAVVSGLIAISSLIGWVAGVEVMQYGSDGIQQGKDEAPLFSVIVVVALMGTMAWGLWRARYWAVLGFQALMVIVMITGSLFLIQAMSWAEALVTTGLIAGAGALFFFMIKAMARIQMPQRPGAEPPRS
jgi:hypothetical protein